MRNEREEDVEDTGHEIRRTERSQEKYWRIVGISILMTFLVGGVELGLYFDQPSGSLENGKLYVNTTRTY